MKTKLVATTLQGRSRRGSRNNTTTITATATLRTRRRAGPRGNASSVSFIAGVNSDSVGLDIVEVECVCCSHDKDTGEWNEKLCNNNDSSKNDKNSKNSDNEFNDALIIEATGTRMNKHGG